MYIPNLFAITNLIEQFARGGGGGSSGGGDGGGEIIAAIGYGIGYAICKPIKKYAPKESAMLISIIAISIATVAIASVLLFGSLSSSFLTWYVDVLIIIGLITAWYTVMYGTWGKLAKRFKKADEKLAAAALQDAVWNEEKLHAHAKDVFMRYQNDWTILDAAHLLEYMTNRFAEKSYYLMEVLRSLNRQNAVVDPIISQMDTIDVYDDADNSKDVFIVAIEAKANDMLIDMTSRETIFEDVSTFIEYWRFVRSGDTWLLDDIEQHTKQISALDTTIKNFADANNLHYSIDMGWLFLPARGQVFKGGRFGKSDINNHVVGHVGELLIQLYTYSTLPGNDDNKTYAIGQIALPKFYGNILVRPKQFAGGFFSVNGSSNVSPTEDSTKYEYEWSDFNKKFEVYATDADRLASFELINPKFMEMMYAIDEKMVLEVVDNTVYFRVSTNASALTYEALFALLKQAYKELKR